MMQNSTLWQLLTSFSVGTSNIQTSGWNVLLLGTRHNNIGLTLTARLQIISQKTAPDLSFVTANQLLGHSPNLWRVQTKDAALEPPAIIVTSACPVKAITPGLPAIESGTDLLCEPKPSPLTITHYRA